MGQRQRVISRNANAYARAETGRPPVRLSAVNYYFLAAFVSAGVFFIVWAFLHDGYDDTPIFIATISAVLCAGSFVLVREVVGRRTRKREAAAHRLSEHLRLVGGNHGRNERNGKLTLKRNEELLSEIRTKSEAAKILGKLADAHKEVFDLCEEYLTIAAAELSTAHPTSPRVPALRKGTLSASKRHRFHMLKWAEIKARSFTAQAADGSMSAKIDAGHDALVAVDRAIEVYPDESTLIDSRDLLRAFLTSANVKLAIEEAEAAEDNDKPELAVKHYRDALASLEKYDVKFDERILIYDKIRLEIKRIEQAG